MTRSQWPDLSALDLATTLETLHLWSQVAGKTKISAKPWVNESWHVPLYLSASGLTTGLVLSHDAGFELSFDLLAGELRLITITGAAEVLPLAPMSVASFHAAVLRMLSRQGIDIAVWPYPCEIEGAKRFDEDTSERSFHLSTARAYWRALLDVQRVFERFRSRFVGKCSPVHFFWGSFDLAVTRFSGRLAPLATRGGPGMPLRVAQDAYAGEQASCGFWPGGSAGIEAPAFYIEAWPAPDGFAEAPVEPSSARFVEALGEWVLDYASVRASADPDATLLAFLQSGYAAIADAGGWDRAVLEREEGPIGHPPALPRRD